MNDRQSILSHGEREIAALLRQGYSIEEIATERDDSPQTVEQSVDRIRQKTHRAVATLLQSPFTEATVAELAPTTCDTLQSRISQD